MENWINLQNTLTLARLAGCFEDRKELPYRVSSLLPLNEKEEVERAEGFYLKKVNQARERGETVPFERLYEICEYDTIARDVLALTLAAFSFPQLYDLFRFLGYNDGITLELVLELHSMEKEEIPEFAEQKKTFERLKRILRPGEPKEAFFRTPFSMDERVYSYLSGENVMESCLDFLCRKQAGTGEDILWIHQKETGKLEEFLWDDVRLIQLAGPSGTGKRHLVRYVCRKIDLPVMEVDGSLLCSLKPEEREGAVWRIHREMLLLESAVCLYGIRGETKNDRGTDVQILMRQVLYPLLESGYPVFVCSEVAADVILASDLLTARIELEELNRNERIALWEGWLAHYGVMGIDTAVLSAKFRLNGREIQKAAGRLAFLSQKEKLTEDLISRECMLVLPNASMGNLKREKTSQTLEDLKLPEPQKKILQNISSHILYRHQVYDVWNLEKRYAYGKTVSALFTGPPGTGKTMAVHVLANMLSLPLYTVDLSQVIDKYIGETQKRLEEIFVIAEKSSSILFFDEADAIFGKRSEVNDSKDRYANAEVAYILQRMEKYDGIVILASNFQKNIDEAFMRRIRYLVHFEMPDEAIRKELWQSCFAKETPLDMVDFDYLAKTFEFSGGSIKNVALNAAFLAAEEGKKIGMPQIIRSIKHEYLKQGKSIFAADFGAYGVYLQ